MKLPTIHLNGTSREELVQQRVDVVEALDAVETVIGKAWPHGRDYYPQGPDALVSAQQVWKDRWNAIAEIREEVKAEGIHLARVYPLSDEQEEV